MGSYVQVHCRDYVRLHGSLSRAVVPFRLRLFHSESLAWLRGLGRCRRFPALYIAKVYYNPAGPFLRGLRTQAGGCNTSEMFTPPIAFIHASGPGPPSCRSYSKIQDRVVSCRLVECSKVSKLFCWGLGCEWVQLTDLLGGRCLLPGVSSYFQKAQLGGTLQV